MKKFQGIIESPTPPPINCFWLYNGTVRYFNNKTSKWESVNSSESNSDILKITISEEDLNKVLNGEQVIIKNNKISPYAEVFYSIKGDGSIIKDEDYIKPNEPYTIQLDSNDIGKPLEDVMASHILNCGEIIVNGVTGPVTYTRSVDSTESMIYFISSKKDNSFQILTYNVSSKTITSAISKYTVPAATKSSIGGVKAMTNIADVVNGSTTQDTVDVLVGTVNSLLSQLRAVGLIIN